MSEMAMAPDGDDNEAAERGMQELRYINSSLPLHERTMDYTPGNEKRFDALSKPIFPQAGLLASYVRPAGPACEQDDSHLDVPRRERETVFAALMEKAFSEDERPDFHRVCSIVPPKPKDQTR